MNVKPVDRVLAYWRGLGAPAAHVAKRLGYAEAEIATRLDAAEPMAGFAGYPSITPWHERTVDVLIRTGLARLPADRPFLHLGGEGSLSAAEVTGLLARLCAGLTELGVGPGAPLAVDATQRLESYLLAVAAMLLGAPLVRLAGYADGAAMCGLLEAAPVALTVSANVDATKGLAAAGIRLGLDDCGAPAFLDWLETCPDADMLPQVAVGPADLALIGFTSGSTGAPKCIHTSHEAVFRSSEAMQANFGFTADDVFTTATDFSALSAFRSLVTMPLLTGGQVLLPSAAARTSPLAFALEAEAAGATRITAVPAALRNMVAVRDRLGAMAKLRMALSGSGILDQPTRDRFEAAFGVPAVDYYGAREIGTAIYADRSQPGTLSSVGGRPCNALVALIDDDGVEVAPGMVGQIMLHADTMMQDPPAPPHVDWRGWLATGDLGRADVAGNIRIVGRRREVIKARDGTLIFPLEIEAMLQAHPAIEEAVVFGHTANDGQEHIVAAVLLRTALSDVAGVARRHVLALGGQQRVPSVVVALDALPRVAAQKPDRARLRSVLALQLAEL